MLHLLESQIKGLMLADRMSVEVSNAGGPNEHNGHYSPPQDIQQLSNGRPVAWMNAAHRFRN